MVGEGGSAVASVSILAGGLSCECEDIVLYHRRHLNQHRQSIVANLSGQVSIAEMGFCECHTKWCPTITLTTDTSYVR